MHSEITKLAASTNVSRRRRSPPVWPLPVLNGRTPVSMGPCRRGPGISLAYARTEPDELVGKYPTTGMNGSASHFMPNAMPVLAVRDGEIAHVGGELRSQTILIDHGNGWASFYRNLEHAFASSPRPARKRERVRAGDVIGHVGLGDAGFKSLDFELWRRSPDDEYETIDPTQEMASWLTLPWIDQRLTSYESTNTVAA